MLAVLSKGLMMAVGGDIMPCEKVEQQDPVRCARCVSSARSCDLWYDASSLATGCAVEIDGVIVEDGAWMRKKDDNAHINLSELDLKDVNMALKWSVLDINIKTDSATRRAKLGQIQGGCRGPAKIRQSGGLQ